MRHSFLSIACLTGLMAISAPVIACEFPNTEQNTKAATDCATTCPMPDFGVEKWVNRSIKQVMEFGYYNYKTHLDELDQKYFTKSGAKEFQKFAIKENLINDMRSDQMIIQTAFEKEDVTLNKTEACDYSVTASITVSLIKPDPETREPITLDKKMDLEIFITPDPSLPKGYGIASWQAVLADN